MQRGSLFLICWGGWGLHFLSIFNLKLPVFSVQFHDNITSCIFSDYYPIWITSKFCMVIYVMFIHFHYSNDAVHAFKMFPPMKIYQIPFYYKILVYLFLMFLMFVVYLWWLCLLPLVMGPVKISFFLSLSWVTQEMLQTVLV